MEYKCDTIKTHRFWQQNPNAKNQRKFSTTTKLSLFRFQLFYFPASHCYTAHFPTHWQNSLGEYALDDSSFFLSLFLFFLKIIICFICVLLAFLFFYLVILAPPCCRVIFSFVQKCNLFMSFRKVYCDT